MKLARFSLWLLISAGLFSTHAQYSARRLTGRLFQNPGYGNSRYSAAPNRYAPPAQMPAPPPAPAPAAPYGRPVARAVMPQEDPALYRAEHEEAERKTVEFQKKRAKEGQPSAQYELGLRYLTGRGVPQDEKEGRRWLELSAKNGSRQAAKKLAELDRKQEYARFTEDLIKGKASSPENKPALANSDSHPSNSAKGKAEALADAQKSDSHHP